MDYFTYTILNFLWKPPLLNVGTTVLNLMLALQFPQCFRGENRKFIVAVDLAK